ncbi:acyl-CoA dehydrogenase family protein [Lentzea aerocolonigenes]|uniref:acyl-CoA dehydrogenase family protein n=1 Tax=Lentzea aerocolonigenes TaxID=68170 RepID=UPI00068ED98B|nr:acyl-CoA dehydrogenase family protein [Lentzea aerocolonigenes]MCP2248803.1 Acyl-CoA dehydrogenase [Lentzea aerocolonigenes]
MSSVAGEVARFCGDVLAHAPRPDHDTVYDDRHPLWQKFAAAGLANWWVPERFGGAGASTVDGVRIAAEIAYHDPGFAFTSFLPVLASRMLELYGGPGLAQEHLRGLVSSGGFCAALGSEAVAGSELTNTATTFRRTGDVLVLNGEKAFSTNLAFARFCLVLARADDDPREFAMILVPAGAEGFEAGPRWRMSGLLGTGTHPATFTDCVVPAANELAGSGIRILEVGLNASRIMMAAMAVGMIRRLRDLHMAYAADKRLGGRPLTRNAIFAARLGQLEMELETVKSQCHRAALDYDELHRAPDAGAAFLAGGVLKSAVVAKMHAGQTGWRIASTASESFGGLGYTEQHDVQWLLRSMRHISIVEGGDDVLRDLIYGRYVKRPSRRG